MVHRFRIVAFLVQKERHAYGKEKSPRVTRKLICGKVSQKQCQTAKLATEMLQLILNIKAVSFFWNYNKFILNISYS